MNKSSEIYSTFVILFEEDDIFHASITAGRTPAEAVEQYYIELDAYCSPNLDDDYHEEFDVRVYYLPTAFSEDFVDELKDLESEELVDKIKALAKENASITCVVVHVTSTAEGMTFS